MRQGGGAWISHNHKTHSPACARGWRMDFTQSQNTCTGARQGGGAWIYNITIKPCAGVTKYLYCPKVVLPNTNISKYLYCPIQIFRNICIPPQYKYFEIFVLPRNICIGGEYKYFEIFVFPHTNISKYLYSPKELFLTIENKTLYKWEHIGELPLIIGPLRDRPRNFVGEVPQW